MTKLHAGGKFGGGGYKVSGGLHGVGASVVNALSDWLVVEVERDGNVYRQEFDCGVPRGAMQTVGESKGDRHDDHVPRRRRDLRGGRSTRPRCSRFREVAFLTRGLRISFTDERADGGKPVEFHYEGGIKDYVSFINESKDIAHRHVVYFATGTEQGEVEVAMQWNSSYQESVFSFANNINTHEAGSHMSGFRSALTSTINRYARDKTLLKEKDDNLEGEDVREGLAAVISVKLPGPAVRGPDQDEARQPMGDGLSRRAVNQKLAEFFEENPTDARQIINKAVAAQRERQAARRRAS